MTVIHAFSWEVHSFHILKEFQDPKIGKNYNLRFFLRYIFMASIKGWFLLSLSPTGASTLPMHSNTTGGKNGPKRDGGSL